MYLFARLLRKTELKLAWPDRQILRWALSRGGVTVGEYGHWSCRNATEGRFRPKTGHCERQGLEHFHTGMVWASAGCDVTGPSRHLFCNVAYTSGKRRPGGTEAAFVRVGG